MPGPHSGRVSRGVSPVQKTTGEIMTIKSTHTFAAMAAALIATACVVAAPAQAESYDGYCYQKETAPRTKGTIVGALAGAAVGNVVAGDGHKQDGTIVGALVGAAVGNAVGNENKKKQKYTESANCLNGRYYIYNDSYYEPSPPPRGYRVAYFNERPRYSTYYVNENGREEVYDRRRHDHHGNRH
jgi:hypothetical protein